MTYLHRESVVFHVQRAPQVGRNQLRFLMAVGPATARNLFPPVPGKTTVKEIGDGESILKNIAK